VYPFIGETYESVYIFPRLTEKELEIEDYVSSSEYQDGVYKTYSTIRNKIEEAKKIGKNLDLGDAETNDKPRDLK